MFRLLFCCTTSWRITPSWIHLRRVLLHPDIHRVQPPAHREVPVHDTHQAGFQVTDPLKKGAIENNLFNRMESVSSNVSERWRGQCWASCCPRPWWLTWITTGQRSSPRSSWGVRQPKAIWCSEMRQLMIQKIAHHLADFHHFPPARSQAVL